MSDWIKVFHAADAVSRWHVQQRRKGAAQEPYVNHLLEVAALVAEATKGDDPEIIIAALLHDAIEDQQVPRSVIAERWGENVAVLVEEMTDDKSLPKDERKRKQVEDAPHKSERARRIKLADKISNVRAIANSPPPDWLAGRKLEYVAWARQVVAKVRGTDVWLERLFDEAADLATK